VEAAKLDSTFDLPSIYHNVTSKMKTSQDGPLVEDQLRLQQSTLQLEGQYRIRHKPMQTEEAPSRIYDFQRIGALTAVGDVGLRKQLLDPHMGRNEGYCRLDTIVLWTDDANG